MNVIDFRTAHAKGLQLSMLHFAADQLSREGKHHLARARLIEADIVLLSMNDDSREEALAFIRYVHPIVGDQIADEIIARGVPTC